MAHPQEKRTQLRGLYVYQRLPMDAACAKAGVARGTANRWKKEAAAAGDDWDKARAAVALGDENMSSLAQKLLEDYLVQHQHTIDLLREATEMSARERAETLASMSDSFNKTMNSFKRLSPEVNRLAIALEVLQRLAAPLPPVRARLWAQCIEIAAARFQVALPPVRAGMRLQYGSGVSRSLGVQAAVRWEHAQTAHAAVASAFGPAAPVVGGGQPMRGRFERADTPICRAPHGLI